MHRRIKGLLSLALVFVMVTATVNPVLADELPQEPLAEEAVEQPQTTVETAAAQEQPQTWQEIMEEQPKTEETQTETEQQTTVETQITQLETESVTETQPEGQQRKRRGQKNCLQWKQILLSRRSRLCQRVQKQIQAIRLIF